MAESVPARDAGPRPNRLAAIAHDAERTLVVLLVGVLLVSAGIWAVDWYRSWGDLSRCPDRGSSLRAQDIAKGGWAEPDTCLYRNLATGATVYPDASIAGPPPRPVSFGRVLAWVSLAGVVCAAVHLWRRDLARRGIDPADP